MKYITSTIAYAMTALAFFSAAEIILINKSIEEDWKCQNYYSFGLQNEDISPCEKSEKYSEIANKYGPIKNAIEIYRRL